MFGQLLKILSRPAVLVLLFCMSLTLFSWPLLGAAESGSLEQAHFTLFSMWTAVVLALWVVTKAISMSQADNEKGLLKDDEESH